MGIKRKIKSFEVRIEGRYTVTESGCHIWHGLVNKKGYARLNIGYVHRLRYAHSYGPIPPWLWCLHRCNNSRCINPEHIYLGDHAQNMADMREACRQGHGENHYNAKFTEADVLKIRLLRQSGARVCDIARSYGVRHQQVSMICNRQTWRHI